MKIDDILDIECPNCGERVYFEALVCPKCGTRLYPDDEEEEYQPAAQPRASPGGRLGGLSAKGILVGALAAAGVDFLLNQAAVTVSPTRAGIAAQALLLAAGPVSALAGGYLCAALARRGAALNGWVVGIASLAPAFFFETFWPGFENRPVAIATLIAWAVMVGCGALGGWIWERLDLRAMGQSLFPLQPRAGEKQVYRELLVLVHQDASTAERLIDLERRRNPTLTRNALIQNAVDRLKRDRR